MQVYLLPYARLLGKLGDGPILSVGEGGTFTANANGTLLLRIHDADACLGDNDGSVRVSVTPPGPVADPRGIGNLLETSKITLLAHQCLTGSNNACIELTLELLGVTLPKSKASKYATYYELHWLPHVA